MAADGDAHDNGGLDMKSVAKLCELCLERRIHFKVAYYQRGYRWKEAQVRQLLEDLHEFSPTHKAPFYFLQALVVSEHKDEWYIVDGQQRLTTIALVQQALEMSPVISICYERTPSDGQTGTIDSHYRKQAEETIGLWFKGKTDADKTAFKDKLSKASFLLYRIPYDDELAVFGRLNSGKISAKDSELVKCVMLTPLMDEPFGVTQARAREWDEIDRALTDDRFLAFFVRRDTWGANDRMAMLFCRAGLCSSIGAARERNEVFPFLDCVQAEIRKTSRRQVWQKIYSAYYTLAAWYNNPVMYHAAGWYMHRKDGASVWSMTINEIRSQLSDKAWTVAQAFMSEQKAQMPDGDGEDYFNRHRESEDYLFLLNVAFCWRRWPMRYDFNRHRQIASWSLEHIVARNERDLDKETFLKLYPRLLTEADWSEYQKSCNENRRDQWLNEKLEGRWPVKDDHNIRNLALLGKAENSSLNDNLFEGKRGLILDWSSGKNGDGYWAPPATQAVFFKTIPGTDPWTPYWNENDKEKYVEYMCKEVKDFVAAAQEVCRVPEGVK